MRENRTYGSEGGEASAFPTLSDSEATATCREQPGKRSPTAPGMHGAARAPLSPPPARLNP